MASTGRRRRRRLGLEPAFVLRIVAAALFLIAAGWLTIAVGGAAAIRPLDPQTALRLMPADARAKAALSEQLVTGAAGRENLAEAERLAREALHRDPTAILAWRSLALMAASRNDLRVAATLFGIVERMSRRDVASQLWMIEEKVRRGDVRGALGHYDVALRTAPGTGDVLLPVMISALRERGVIRPLAERLIARPPWLSVFYFRLTQQIPPGDRLAELLEILRAAGATDGFDALVPIVPHLADRGEYQAAWRVYRTLSPSAPSAAGAIRNGGFERPNPVAPFDWELATGSGFGSETRSIDGAAGPALHLYASSDTNGNAARQLLMLAPGSYELSALVGRYDEAPPQGLSIRIVCAGPSPVELLAADFTPAQGPPRRRTAAVRVPVANCPAQWININIAAGFDPAGGEAWIDGVELRRRGG